MAITTETLFETLEVGTAVVGAAADGGILAGDATRSFNYVASTNILSLNGAAASISSDSTITVSSTGILSLDSSTNAIQTNATSITGDAALTVAATGALSLDSSTGAIQTNATSITADAALSVDGTGALSFGPTNATSVAVGSSGIGTTVNGWANVGATTVATGAGQLGVGNATRSVHFTQGAAGAGEGAVILAGDNAIQTIQSEKRVRIIGGVDASLAGVLSGSTAVSFFAGGTTAASSRINLTAPSLASPSQGGAVDIFAGDGVSGGAGATNGGRVRIVGGEASDANVTGGNVEITGGSSDVAGLGSLVQIKGGGNGTTGGSGGDILIQGGAGPGFVTDRSGNVTIVGGGGEVAAMLGGNVELKGGAGGSATGNGGDALVDGGTTVGGVAGDVNIGTGVAVAVNVGRSAGTIGFFGATAVVQQANIVSLTDSSGGTPNDTIAAITNAANAGSADVGPTADAIADLAAKVNGVLTILNNLGLMA